MKMKKWLTVLLAVLLAFGAFPAGSFAEEQGLFRYEVKKNGTAKITGINDTTIRTLEIPAELDGHPVTAIGSRAFINLKNLQLVVIPEGVGSVESLAFEYCTSLESVSIPDSLVSVELLAFVSCPKLKTVVVSPDHPVLAVENKALVNRKNQALIVALEHEDTGTYTVAQGIREIGGFAFDSCRFSAILLPDSVTSVGNGAFSECVNLTEIVLPEGVTKIGSQLFFGCENLVSVTIPDSLTRIGTALFGKTPALTDVRISPDHRAYKMIGSLLVDKRNKEIVSSLNNLPETYEIPEGIRIIGQMAFQGNRDLAEVVVPRGVTRIKYAAFSGCSLRVITLPATLRDIEKNAFESSKGLLIKAPAGSLAEEFSKYRYSFEAIPDESAVKEQDLFREDKADSTAEVAPEEPADEVREESFDSRVSGMYRYEVLADGTAKIISADESLTDGNIPAEVDGHPVTSIGNRAFSNCKSLQSAVIPEGVVFVGNFAFMNCTALESVSIPDSLTQICSVAFGDTPALTDVRISPKHPVYEMIGTLLVDKRDMRIITALNSTPALFEIPEGIKGIGDFAFLGSSRLTEVTVPEGVTRIGENAFSGSLRLRAVTLPASLKWIGDEAFRDYPDLLIKAPADSLGEQYARENGYRFETLRTASVAKEAADFRYRVKEDGTAEITGINDKDIEVMEIPAEVDGYPVTSIYYQAFERCRNLVSAIIPEGVTSIDNRAFWGCNQLESVSIPDSLVSIGEGAFDCGRLTEIKVSPDHPVFAVENEALIDKRDRTLVRFLGPEITGTYEIAQGIRAIGPAAFAYNTNFTTLVIPDSVTEIGEEGLALCRSMKEIVIPDSVVSIGFWAFLCCSGLESVTIPDSVTGIGPDIFYECSSLASINISPDHPVYEVIDQLLVRKADKAVIAASGAIRGKYAVPEEIRIIGERAFWGCGKLEELFIPDTVTEIVGQYAFDRNTTVRACAGSAAQEYCEENSNVRFSEITPEEYADEVRKLEQEKADREAEESVYIWTDIWNNRFYGMYAYKVMEDGTAKIVRADRELRDGNIPAELDGIPVTSIGNEAFLCCADLQSVVIPEGVVSLGRNAFWGCYALESVSIPDSLVSAGGQIFASCRKLKTIEISPDHPVFAVENRALVNRQDQTLIISLDREDTGTYTVAQGIRRIEEHAFDSCLFSSVVLPDSVTSVGNFAFSSCGNLTEFILPEGVAEIGNQVFFSCGKLESITIPDSLAGIGPGFFGHNPALAGIRISPDHPVYEMNGPLLVDKRNREIVSVLNNAPAVYEIPEGIKAIGDEAFMGCTVLTEVIVPEGVKRIGESAFCGCPNLKTVTFPAGTTELAEDAFKSSWVQLIKAPAGSPAEQYARKNGLSFEALPAGTGGAD